MAGQRSPPYGDSRKTGDVGSIPTGSATFSSPLDPSPFGSFVSRLNVPHHGALRRDDAEPQALSSDRIAARSGSAGDCPWGVDGRIGLGQDRPP